LFKNILQIACSFALFIYKFAESTTYSSKYEIKKKQFNPNQNL